MSTCTELDEVGGVMERVLAGVCFLPIAVSDLESLTYHVWIYNPFSPNSYKLFECLNTSQIQSVMCYG